MHTPTAMIDLLLNMSVRLVQALQLEHPDLAPSVAQRIVVACVLHYLHKSEPVTANPYAHVFAKVLKVSQPK